MAQPELIWKTRGSREYVPSGESGREYGVVYPLAQTELRL